jgi:hypothetical protein
MEGVDDIDFMKSPLANGKGGRRAALFLVLGRSDSQWLPPLSSPSLSPSWCPKSNRSKRSPMAGELSGT